MNQQKRFHDNPSGVISDTKHKKQWLPKDSWGDLGQWRSFNEAQGYVLTMNQVYAGGYCDWRLPTQEEAENFFDLEFDQIDWDEEIIHIDPLFVKKCGNFMWTCDINDMNEVGRINLRNGKMDWVERNTTEHQAARLVRNDESSLMSP
jgi:hypothetical protein